MNSTAQKLTAETVVKEFKEAHSNLDLLKVFLITGATDISKSYEIIKTWSRDTGITDADKANFRNALKTLQAIELKRIELTAAMFKVDAINEIVITPIEDKPTIMMLPKIDDLLSRVTVIIKEEKDHKDVNKVAFELLKTTVGQGKALNAEGKEESWDNDMIKSHIEEIEASFTEEQQEVKPVSFGFETIFNHLDSMVKFGKAENEIKDALEQLVMGKAITSTTGDYFIKDKTVFEDYYTRILQGIVVSGIEAKKIASETTETKRESVEKKITDEVTPLLQELDKDEKQKSLVSVTKRIRDLYISSGLKSTLQESLLKAQEIAEKIAPNLMIRYRKTQETSVPIIESNKKTETIEIFDESHNIKETNKKLWSEVEKYELLSQIFTKATELAKKGNWKDALSMAIILITSGKIKETEKSDILKWDTNQIKAWYHTNIEEAIGKSKESEKKEEIIDTKAEIIADDKKGSDKHEKTSESSEESSKEVQEVKQGPVPQAGTIDSKSPLSRLLKDNSQWKDTYNFKSFPLKTDRYTGGAMSLEIVDATVDQEKDLLITEANLTKFFNSQRDILIKSANNYPKVKKEITDKLTPFYELSASEIKGIVGQLAKEGNDIRIANKKSKKSTEDVVNTETSVESNTSSEEENPQQSPEVKETLPGEKEKEEENSNEIETSATENTSGENTTNSNNKTKYEGFGDVLKARDKVTFNKQLFAKVQEYPNIEEGTKAVYDVLNVARKDNNFKKSFLRNYKGAPPADFLATIKKVVELGVEQTSKKE
jgi:hypothetical protein